MPLNPKTIKLEIDTTREIAIEAGILDPKNANDYESVVDAGLDLFVWEVIRTYHTGEQLTPEEQNRLRLAFLNGHKIRLARRNKVEGAKQTERESIVNALLEEDMRRKKEAEKELEKLERGIEIEDPTEYIKETEKLIVKE